MPYPSPRWARTTPTLVAITLLASCGGDSATTDPDVAADGTVNVVVQTTGLDPDADGYEISAAGTSASVGANGQVSFTLPPGLTEFSLSGQAANCVPERVLQVATVRAGASAELSFQVVCFRDPILFQRSDPDGSRGIWVTDASGSVEAVPLVSGAPDRGPVVDIAERQFDWSPDRSLVAYILEDLEAAVPRSLRIIAFNKSEERILNGTSPREVPAFSPDGTRLVFREVVTFRRWDLIQTDLNGGNRSPVYGGDLHFGWNPTWSEDGSRIAFTGKRLAFSPARQGVWVADGTPPSGPEQHTFGLGPLQAGESDGEDWHMDPQFSPDGTSVIFRLERWNTGEVDIYSVPVGQPGVVTPVLENPGVSDFYPRWSPDGSRIAWSQCSGSCPTRTLPTSGALSTELWVMNADGSAPTQLAVTGSGWGLSWNASEDLQGNPATAPAIAYSSSEGGATPHIYVIPASGGDPVQLTDSFFSDIHPIWRP